MNQEIFKSSAISNAKVSAILDISSLILKHQEEFKRQTFKKSLSRFTSLDKSFIDEKVKDDKI